MIKSPLKNKRDLQSEDNFISVLLFIDQFKMYM